MNRKLLLKTSLLVTAIISIVACSADDPKKAPDIQAQTVTYQEALDAIKKTTINVDGTTFNFNTVGEISGGKAVSSGTTEVTIQGSGGSSVSTIKFEGMLGDAITKNSGGKIYAAVGEKKAPSSKTQAQQNRQAKTFTVVLSPGSAEGIAYEFDEQLTKALDAKGGFTIKVTATSWVAESTSSQSK